MKKLTDIILEKKRIDNTDIILGLALVNPNMLDFLNDIKNKYTLNSQVLQQLMKYTVMKYSDKLNWEIPNNINNIDIDIEKSWNMLKKIQQKVNILLNKHEDIKKVTFTKDGLIINNTDNLFYKDKKKYSSRKIFDSIFGINDNLIYAHEDKLNSLIRFWLKLVFKHASPETKGYIEEFIFDNMINEVTFKEYFKITANEEYKYLGLRIKSLDRNFKKLYQLLSVLYKNPAYWIDYNGFKEKWQYVKNEILNKQIILPIMQEKIDTKAIKNNVLHFLADHFNIQDDEYTNINTLEQMPSKNQFLNSKINLSISFWNNDNFDFIYIIKCLTLDNKELGSIEIEIGWPSGTPEQRLSANAKLHKLNIKNIIQQEY